MQQEVDSQQWAVSLCQMNLGKTFVWGGLQCQTTKSRVWKVVTFAVFVTELPDPHLHRHCLSCWLCTMAFGSSAYQNYHFVFQSQQNEIHAQIINRSSDHWSSGGLVITKKKRHLMITSDHHTLLIWSSGALVITKEEQTPHLWSSQTSIPGPWSLPRRWRGQLGLPLERVSRDDAISSKPDDMRVLESPSETCSRRWPVL